MVVPSPYSVRKLHKKRRRRRIFMLVRRKIAYSPSAARSFISKCRKFFLLLSSWAHQRSWYCFCPIRYCYTHPWWYVIIINTKMAYGQTRPCYIDAPSYIPSFFFFASTSQHFSCRKVSYKFENYFANSKKIAIYILFLNEIVLWLLYNNHKSVYSRYRGGFGHDWSAAA